MQLNITQKGRSLSVNLGDTAPFDLNFQEGLLNSNWSINRAGRDFVSIEKSRRFFSSNADVKVSFKNVFGSETLLLNYKNRMPNATFEYRGNIFQIVFHTHNRFSYFLGDQQFARTELRAFFNEAHYEGFFNEQIIDPHVYLLSHLGLIYLNTVSDNGGEGFSVVIFRSFLYGELRSFDEGWKE